MLEMTGTQFIIGIAILAIIGIIWWSRESSNSDENRKHYDEY